MRLSTCLLLPLLLLTAVPSRAQSVPTRKLGCTQVITSLPFDIDVPGSYCLGTSLVAAGTAYGVHIRADGVTLDCKDMQLAHGNPGNEASAILGDARSNVVIKNCRIANFAEGIHFGPRSRGIQVLNNVISGAKLDGIVLWANGSRVIGNRVLDTHGDGQAPYQRNITITAFEPGVPSTGNLVQDNTIAGAHGTSTIYGLRLDKTNNALVMGNQFLDLQPTSGGNAYAILVDGIGARLLDNTMAARVPGNQGLSLTPGTSCSGNIAIGLADAGFTGCTSSVDNVVLP